MEALHKHVADLLDTRVIDALPFDEHRAFIKDVTQARGDINNLTERSRELIKQAEAERAA